MVAVGGGRPVDGGTFYANTQNYEAVLLDVRSRMDELNGIQTRKTYLTSVLNYGNLDEEMSAEVTRAVGTPSANGAYTNNGLGAGNYSLRAGTPLFIENMFANSVRYMGLSAVGSTTSAIVFDPTRLEGDFIAGMEIEVNGEVRTIDSITGNTLNLNQPLSAPPGIGSHLLIKGREYVNPFLNESYRVTDRYSSYLVDENRYQVDRVYGLVRYRPRNGNNVAGPAPGGALPNGGVNDYVWHPENALNTPYYFGKMVPVRTTPPSAVAPGGPPTGAEELGNPIDPVASNAAPNISTAFNLPAPDGEYTNIRISSPPGVTYEVELNGAKLAISNTGGVITIPFFDPNHQNDQLKANESIDPDIYIQRFVKEGNNHLVIRATQTDSATSAGIRVEGMFNGVDLSTTNSFQSINTLDWSASKRSVLGIVGKIEYRLQDQVAIEDTNDELQKAQGVLASLTTIIAGTDTNQFKSILSVIR